MIHITVKKLAEMIPVLNDVSGFNQMEINGVSINTKSIKKGNLFIPLRGENRDGHEFVSSAFANGAAASLWQKNMPNPPEDVPLIFVENTLNALHQLAVNYRNELSNLKVVAVTGSNGKTTTKDMIAQLLSCRYKVQKTIGNFNNHIGLPLTVLELKKETEIAVLEMGMNHFGEIEFLSKMAKPDVAVITNIGDAHLQELGSREGIARAKLEILTGLKEGGLFIYPGDEPLISGYLKTKDLPWSLKTFGKHPHNDIYPTEIQGENNGTRFTVNTNESYYLPVLGEYNVYNALAAILVAKEWNISSEKLNEAFFALRLSQMRMEMTDGWNGSTIINDAYNASPTSMKAAVQAIYGMDGFAKKIVVLGDMLELGKKEKEYHLELGRFLNQNKLDYVYTYGKLAEKIAEGAATSFGKERVFAFQDKKDLAKHLKPKLDKKTVVLVKGSRGMKLEDIIHILENNNN